MSGLEKLSKKVQACVTCDLWKGQVRNPSDDRLYVIFESFQRGVCSGPLKAGHSMTPMNRCRAWRLWKKMNKPRVDNKGFFEVDYEEGQVIGGSGDTEETTAPTFERDTDHGRGSRRYVPKEEGSKDPSTQQAPAPAPQPEVGKEA